MNKTNIEYMDYSWNPIAMRCTPISEGCSNCWHIKMADRLSKMPGIMFAEEMSYRGINRPYLVKERLNDPLKRKKPSIIGVQFMGDLFHEHVRFNDIQSVLHHMWLASQHTYMILTKRPEIMMAYGKRNKAQNGWTFDRLKNFYLGVTAENQQRADERIPILLQIPAAKRFVSIEPMLGPVDLTDITINEYQSMDALKGNTLGIPPKISVINHHQNKLDWVILGGESGPGARPMHPDWARSVRDQCQEAGVPFFFKQWGEWTGESGWYLKDDKFYKSIIMDRDELDKIGISMGRVGKKKAGRLLDGREWNERPN